MHFIPLEVSSQLERLAPEIPFPAYAFVPRKFPHPTRDPEGHSYGRPEPKPIPLTADNWSQSADYLHGIDLFNHGYFWEAHEAWEGLWHACGRQGDVAGFLKALIKLAAAGVKAREENPNGVQRAAQRAARLFETIRLAQPDSSATFLGFSFDSLVELAFRLPHETAHFSTAALGSKLPTFASRMTLAPSSN
ncbi:MAG: hypothetical protein ACI9OJ_000403 [Myxococcota bacterium]